MSEDPAIVGPADETDDALYLHDPRREWAEMTKYLALAGATQDEIKKLDMDTAYRGLDDLRVYVCHRRKALNDKRFEPPPTEIRRYLGLSGVPTLKNLGKYAWRHFKGNW